MPGSFCEDPEGSIVFDSLEELAQYFEPKEICVWCGGEHHWATCSVIGSTGSINSSVFTSLEQAGHEHRDPYTDNFNWGNNQEPSYGYDEGMKGIQDTPIELHTVEETTCEHCYKKLAAIREKEMAT